MRRAGAVALSALIGVSALTCATQTLAYIFGHQAALGAPAARLGTLKLYWPWSVLSWSTLWREAYPRPFAFAGGVLLFGAGGSALCLTLLTGKAPLRSHAPRPWATLRE